MLHYKNGKYKNRSSWRDSQRKKYKLFTILKTRHKGVQYIYTVACLGETDEQKRMFLLEKHT
jgi:hypothetical protein